jgi:hypothetical protein
MLTPLGTKLAHSKGECLQTCIQSLSPRRRCTLGAVCDNPELFPKLILEMPFSLRDTIHWTNSDCKWPSRTRENWSLHLKKEWYSKAVSLINGRQSPRCSVQLRFIPCTFACISADYNSTHFFLSCPEFTKLFSQIFSTPIVPIILHPLFQMRLFSCQAGTYVPPFKSILPRSILHNLIKICRNYISTAN